MQNELILILLEEPETEYEYKQCVAETEKIQFQSWHGPVYHNIPEIGDIACEGLIFYYPVDPAALEDLHRIKERSEIRPGDDYNGIEILYVPEEYAE